MLNTTKAMAVLNDENSTIFDRAFASFVVGVDGKTVADWEAVADAVNKKYLAETVASLWDGNKFDWASFVDGVAYPFIDVEANTDTDFFKKKTVLVRDVFCKKKTKNSTKNTVDGTIYGMVAQLGVNMGIAFADDHKEVVSMLKVFCKYSDAPKVFFDGTPSSNNAMEKQLQVIADTMLGKDAVKIKKMYVTHAKDTFIRANKDGYKNGNELAFLQIVVDHIKDAKDGKKYTHVSKLDAHKEPKEKNTKK